MYINDLHLAIKHSKVHHFADDTNLLHINKSIKNLNKIVNYDLKNLSCWLNANKISLNVSKTEWIIFKPRKKVLNYDLKIKLNGNKLYTTSSVKYLGIRIDENLIWNQHFNDLATKLNRANAMLFKIRNYVNSETLLRSICFAIFESHLTYSFLVWGQDNNSIKHLAILQKKAIRIMNFEKRNAHTNPLFKKSKILKLLDTVMIENCIFVNKSLNNLLPSIFQNWFSFSSDIHPYRTSSSSLCLLHIPSFNTNKYGKHSIITSAIYSWNHTQKQIKDLSLFTLKPNKLKSLLSSYFLDLYAWISDRFFTNYRLNT